MDTIRLPPDFKDFLRLLNSHGVEYLVIGGYAVGFHGYPRATGDLDVWVAIHPKTAGQLVAVLKEFGFDIPQLSPELFLQEGRVIRMGVPPVRLEILTSIDGVDFSTSYAGRLRAELDGIPANLINLRDLRANKRASGRYKDLEDLEQLPVPPD